MKLVLALVFYAFCFSLLWAVYGTPEWEALSTGFPHTEREIDTAMIVFMAMLAKLAGHVTLFSTTRAR